MIISYEMNTDGIRLKTVLVDKVTKDDIIDNYLNINIPSVVDGKKVDIVGFQGHHLLHFTDDTNNFLIENGIKLMINIENGPFYIEDFKSAHKFIMSVIIPNSIKQIRFCSFSTCNIEKIVFSEQAVEAISDSAFISATFQEPFVVPKSCITIGEQAFKNCNFLGGFSFHPESNIKEIAKKSFEDANLYSSHLMMPISLQIIKENAFMGSRKIEKISFPEKAKIHEIKRFAFANCECTEVTFKNHSEVFMGESIFRNAYRLKKIDMSTLTNTDIVYKMCCECEKLKVIVLPNNIKVINELAFERCCLSGTLSLPNTLTKIGSGAFKSNNISQICFLDGCNLNTIGEYAFHKNALKEIPDNIFEKVYSCGTGAFADNFFKSLRLIAPKSFDDFKYHVFQGNMYLQSVEFVNTKTNSWTEIPHSMFKNCHSLTDVIIPKSVSKLGEYCFSNTALDNVLLEGVSYIAEGAFSDCSNLKMCTILEQDEPLTICTWAFKGTTSLKKLVLSPFCTGKIYANAFSAGCKREYIQEFIKNSSFVEIV